MAIRFIWKYVNRKSYIIRKNVLSFVIAVSVIQFFSYFCYTNLPLVGEKTEQLMNLNTFSEMYKTSIIENTALFLTGYILAFYIGALSRSNFYGDVVLAAPKNE